MNRYQPDHYDRFDNSNSYQTRRSEKYRHPEQYTSGYDTHQDRYTSGSDYGSGRSNDDYGHRDYDRSSYRNENRPERYTTYGASRNYGNMGSYGGAQGFGSTRAGYGYQRRHDDLSHSFDSGHGDRYGYSDSGYRSSPRDTASYSGRQNNFSDRYRDWDTNIRQSDYNRDRDRDRDRDGRSRSSFGTYSSGRYQERPQRRYYDEDDYPSPGYGGDRGHYMGSGYNRYTHGEYGSLDGDYGSLGSFDTYNRMQDKPYGLSGYYSGGYGSERY